MAGYVGIVSTLSGNASGLMGFAQRITMASQAMSQESKSNDGTTDREYFFEREITVDIEAEFETSISTFPAEGDVIAVSGCADTKFNKNYVVMSSNMAEQTDQYSRYQMQAKAKIGIGSEITYDANGASA